MKLYLDTSTPTCVLKIEENEYRWEAGRDLAEKLLSFMQEKLAENGGGFKDITEITFMAGPGSFTGLRIGAAVINTLTHELKIPLYNHRKERVPVIMPEYGKAANDGKN